MLSQETLFDYYKVNFKLMEDHKYTLNDLEGMIPWEREIYVTLLIQKMQQENDRKSKGN